jgi:hypothetical protein
MKQKDIIAHIKLEKTIPFDRKTRQVHIDKSPKDLVPGDCFEREGLIVEIQERFEFADGSIGVRSIVVGVMEDGPSAI